MSQDFIGRLQAPVTLEEPAWWLVFCQQQLLLQQEEGKWQIPQAMALPVADVAVQGQQYLGLWRQQHCFCAEVGDTLPLASEYHWLPLRQALGHLGEEHFSLLSRAWQTLQWDKDHQFCSRCAAPLRPSTTERAKICPQCHFVYYPRLSPSILVLIKRHKEILLARSPHFASGMYSALAGFVEPGETSEQTVAREVWEEVGLKVKNLRYHASQSWPFPHTLLLGYTADYAAGEIHIDGVEIEDAGWFSRDHLPAVLPSPFSLSRYLIDLFLKEEI